MAGDAVFQFLAGESLPVDDPNAVWRDDPMMDELDAVLDRRVNGLLGVHGLAV